MAVRGQDSALLIEVTVLQAHVDRRCAGQGHVALAVQEALTGQVDGDERGRAERLDGNRGTRQVELVRDDARKGIAIVEDAHRGHSRTGRAHRLRVLEEVHRQIGAHGRAAEGADPPGVLGRVVARHFERGPGALQEETDLRVHRFRLARVEAEEAGIEQLDVVEDGGRLHMGDAVPHRRRVGFEERDRLGPVPQVLPVAVESGRPGDADLHPDDGDVVEVVFSLCAHIFHLEGSRAGSASRCRRRRCIISSRVPARCSTSSRTTGFSSAFSPRARASSPTVGAS